MMERFWSKVDAGGDCWEWTAGATAEGYGMFWVGEKGNNVGAHRVAWEMLIGPIEGGLEIDHLCRNRRCVNPDHLEPVTTRENLRRGAGTNKLYCKRGHLLHRAKGRRKCRTCRRMEANLYGSR